MSIGVVWKQVPDIFYAISESLKNSSNPFSLFNKMRLSISNGVTILPRLYKTIALFEIIQSKGIEIVEQISRLEITRGFANIYPEGIKYCVLEILQCNKTSAKPSFDLKSLSLLERDDLIQMITPVSIRAPFNVSVKETPRDIKQILNGLTDSDHLLAWDGQSEIDRIQISKLIFSEDRRFYEASILLQSSKPQLITLVPSPQWSEMDLLQRQKDLYQMMVIRICAISLGRAALYFSARKPLITEKYPIPKLNFTVQLKPSNITMTLQKQTISEESLNWGYFHNGVSSGLSVSKDVNYLNGSWITFNKLANLTSQHAGFLLGLGLNGHLKNIEEWHIYNYLGPKHTYTSIALLIGMAASNLGTMDTKITRVLSVHIVALLPPGSSDLNISTLVQTAGIVAMGLLYAGSQHRRMTETFLGEIEGRSLTGADALNNEGYKLASGIALGFINLGKGNELQGLVDIMVVERLLGIATKSKDVQTSSVLDVGVPGAIIALLLMFIKTSNIDIARKLAPPQTAQFYDYIRPDFLQIRTLATHLIMWDDVGDTEEWLTDNIPEILKEGTSKNRLSSDQLPYFYVIAGLCMTIGLRHASTGNLRARDTLLTYFDLVTSLHDTHVVSHDQRLTKAALGQIQSSMALSLAIIMAGTGDLETLRRIRMLCLLKNKDTPYGTFMAAQMALGILFLGGGQYGFDRNPLDIAVLVISLYPIFPFTVTENFTHLQPLRYFWALAAKPRCLVTKDIETGNPTQAKVSIRLKNQDKVIVKTTPFLLPELSEIAEIAACDKNYYNLKLDLTHDTAANRFFMRTKTLVLTKVEKNALSKLSFISKSLDSKSDYDYYQFLKILQTIDLEDVSEIKFSGTCTRALDTTKDDLILAAQSIANSPKYTDDLWNLKVIFLFNDKIKDLELSTLLPTGKVEELKTLLWRWKMAHIS